MKTLLVIPCYNHSKYLPDLLKKIRKYYNDDILIIDDGSSCSIKIKQSNLDIIRNDINKGKGFSIIKAAKYAIDNKYSHIITLDSDMQHDPSHLNTIIENFQSSRVNIIQMKKKYENHEGFIKSFFSKIFYTIFEKFTDINIEKGSSDFYLITKKVRDQIINSNISFIFLRGFIHWSGFSKLYITYVPNKRIHGKSKYGFIKQLEFALTGVYFYESKFFVYLLLISLFLFFTALIYIFYIIYSFYFAGSIEQTGWSTLVIILLFFGSFIILLNSFVIFIIMKIFNFVSNKPNFIIDDEK